METPDKPKPAAFAKYYQEWEPQYNWEECKAKREEYGKFLCSYLTTTSPDKGLVVNLNGGWGTGKTHFLKSLYVELANQHHPVVYIDAWESDFSNNPLSVVCSELLNQLGCIKFESETNTAKNINRLKSVMGKCFKYGQGIAEITGNKALGQILKGTGTALGAIDDAEDNSTEGAYAKLVDHVAKGHNHSVEAMRDIKKELACLAEELSDSFQLETPIVFLIDELDRCRPNYAVEMLEVIKHFFETKNCVFLVASDTYALECSIKALYGNDFKSDVYLRRFFDQKVNLPEISHKDYLSLKHSGLLDNVGKCVDIFFENSEVKAFELISQIVVHFELSLRDLDQALNKFRSSLTFISKGRSETVGINYLVLFYGIVEHQLNLECFEYRDGFKGDEVDIRSSVIGSKRNNESWLAQPNTVYHETELSELIRFSFASVTKKKMRDFYTNPNQTTKSNSGIAKLAVIEKSFLDNLTFYDERYTKANYFNKLSQEDNFNYLMWPDYKRVIGLTDIFEG